MVSGVLFETGSPVWDMPLVTQAGDGWSVSHSDGLALVLSKGALSVEWGGVFSGGGGALTSYVLRHAGTIAAQFTGGTLTLADLAGLGETSRSAVFYAGHDLVLSLDVDGIALDLGAGGDTFFGNAGQDSVQGADGADYLAGASGRDGLDGGEGADTLVGDYADRLDVGDVLEGQAGDDYIFAGSGFDECFGGAGNDIVLAGSGGDLASGGSGNDYIYGDYGTDIAGADTLFLEDGDDTAFGGGGADVIYGGLGIDALIGKEGADLLDGGQGDDYLFGDYGVSEGAADTLYGAEGADVIFAGGGDDVIEGEWGGDHIFGGSGADTIRLSGPSEERDYVWFETAGDAGDVILDFAAADLIVVQPLLIAAGLALTAAQAAAQGYLAIVQNGPDARLLFDADVAGVGQAVTVALLNGFDAATFDWGANAY